MRTLRTLGIVLAALSAFQTSPVLAGPQQGPLDPNPTYGPNAPPGSKQWTHQRPEIRSYNSDPVIAERPNAPGKYYDTRTGANRDRGTIGEARRADAAQRAGYYDSPNNVNIAKWAANTNEKGEAENAAISFIDGKGGFKDGRKDLLGSGDNRLSLDVLRAEGNVEAQGGFINGGVQGNVNAHGQVTLVGLNWQNQATLNKGAPVEVTVGHTGQAYIGAEAQIQATGSLTREGLLLNGKAGAFAGGRVTETVTAGVGNPNIGSANVQATGELSYGIGAQAEGYFKIDWTNMSVKYGAKANVTLGVGAGVGVQGEISIKPLVDNTIAFAKNTVVPALGRGVQAVGNGLAAAGNAIGNAGSAVGSFFGGLFGSDPKPATAPVAVASGGYNGARQTPSVPLGGPASGGTSSTVQGGAGLETGR